MTDEELIEAMVHEADRWVTQKSGMRAALAVVREAWGKDAERWQEFLRRARVTQTEERLFSGDVRQCWSAWFDGDHKHVNHAVDAAIAARAQEKQ